MANGSGKRIGSARVWRERVMAGTGLRLHVSEAIGMKCSIDGCPGEYEGRKIVHTVQRHDQVIVIDHVPADVCSVCGDALLKPDTVRRIEVTLQQKSQPARRVPLYEFA